MILGRGGASPNGKDKKGTRKDRSATSAVLLVPFFVYCPKIIDITIIVAIIMQEVQNGKGTYCIKDEREPGRDP